VAAMDKQLSFARVAMTMRPDEVGARDRHDRMERSRSPPRRRLLCYKEEGEWEDSLVDIGSIKPKRDDRRQKEVISQGYQDVMELEYWE
jgi:hypothetical protein